MGLSSSANKWNICSDTAVAGLEGITKEVDDILIQGPDYPTLWTRLKETLEKCREHAITISKQKIEMGDTIKFAGYIISRAGIAPDEEKTKAIRDFPAPTDIAGVRSLLGLVNQLNIFIPDVAHLTAHIRALLRKDVAFTWTEAQQNDFDNIKAAIIAHMSIQHFDPKCRMHLLTDASRLKGFGYALVQFDSSDRMSLIRCGSHSLKETEQHYATVELECLAITWAISEFQHHLLGCPEPFTVVTDHRPLLGVFSKDLPSLKNTRLQRLRQKVMDCQFQVTWAPGKSHLIADALSHAPVFTPPEEVDKEIAECFAIRANLAVHSKIVPHIDDSYIAVRQALQADARLAKHI